MIRSLAALLTLSFSLSASAGGVIVGNGAGFAEFLMMRLQPELPARWELAVRGGSCDAEAARALLTGARSLRGFTAPLRFLDPVEFAALSRQRDVLVSPVHAALAAHARVLFVDRLVAASWTDEKIALDVLTEGHLLRLGASAELRAKARACATAPSIASYVTTDLKSYRQPAVGLLAMPAGSIVVTDSDWEFKLATEVTGCARPYLDSRSLGVAARGAGLRWNVLLRLNPACRAGSAIIVTADFDFAVGGFGAFLGGDPRVRLKLTNATAQVVR